MASYLRDGPTVGRWRSRVEDSWITMISNLLRTLHTPEADWTDCQNQRRI